MSEKKKITLSLAPMAGFSDRAMRLVCHKYGADFSVSEMISAKAVYYGDKKTFALSEISSDEGPVVLQIFGSEPEIMAYAARTLSEREMCARPVGIDINMGCPVHKIYSNGEGSALMRSPELIEKIVSAVRSAVSLPVSVKIRTGIDEGSVNAVECALAAEAGGASYLTIHGRTRKQMYSGEVDRKTIKNVKSSLHIPVIANGDVTSVESAVSMIEETFCDGIAIGRGAVGNPFIFEEIKAAFNGEPVREITLEEKKETALLQLREAVLDKGEKVAVCEARKQIALYFKGYRGVSLLRGEINKATTFLEIENIFSAIKE